MVQLTISNLELIFGLVIACGLAIMLLRAEEVLDEQRKKLAEYRRKENKKFWNELYCRK